MKNIFVLLITSIGLFSCSGGMDMSGLSKEEKLEYKIIGKIEKRLKKEKGLYSSSIGSEDKGTYFIRDIGFHYNKSINIDEMRELLVYIVQMFIENYNQSKELLSYVKEPYTIKNFEITIYLDKDLPPPALSIGGLSKEMLKYYSYDKEGEGTGIKGIYKETYQEALEKLGKK